MFAEKNKLLFHDGDLAATLRAQQASIPERVNRIPKDQFLSASTDALVEHVLAEVEVVPLAVYRDRMTMEQSETTVDVTHDRMRVGRFDGGPISVPGVEVVVSLPFTGDIELWRLQPSTYSLSGPRGNPMCGARDGAGTLDIVIEHPSDKPADDVRQLVDGQLADIESYVAGQRRDVEAFNAGLPTQIRGAVSARRQRLEKDSGISAALGIPLKPKPGAEDHRPITLERRKPTPLPDAPAGSYQPEPGISDEDYGRVLMMIRQEGRSFETTPGTFAKLDEEELRDVLLAHLNGHFEGRATGETFRKHGKTDIRIEEDDRSAFVAECKVWGGGKRLGEACDQLLGYLTWRDCRTAIVVFNKKVAGFSTLLEEMPAAFRAHPNFRREHAVSEEGEWCFDMSSRDDAGREVRVHAFAFNLYSKK